MLGLQRFRNALRIPANARSSTGPVLSKSHVTSALPTGSAQLPLQRNIYTRVSQDPFLTLFRPLGYQPRVLGFEDVFEEMQRELSRDPFFCDLHQMDRMWPFLGLPSIEVEPRTTKDAPEPSAQSIQVKDVNKSDEKAATASATTESAAVEPQEQSTSKSVTQTQSAPESSWLTAYARAPTVDLIERDDEYQINVDVPGVRKEDLKVQVTEDFRGRKVLTVSGERKTEESSEDKDGWRSSQRLYGRFSRSLRLPEHCKAEEIRAKQENGVLQITVPKAPAPVTKPLQEININ